MSATEGTQTLRVPAGHTLEIALEYTPGSGAIWHLPAPPADTLVTRSESRPVDPRIGGTGRQIFLFKAEAAGTRELIFELRRPWETTVRARHRVTVHVE